MVGAAGRNTGHHFPFPSDPRKIKGGFLLAVGHADGDSGSFCLQKGPVVHRPVVGGGYGDNRPGQIPGGIGPPFQPDAAFPGQKLQLPAGFRRDDRDFRPKGQKAFDPAAGDGPGPDNHRLFAGQGDKNGKIRFHNPPRFLLFYHIEGL